LGTLSVLGHTLGPVESLSFAVVIGVSVDYLVHLAYAYKHSFMRENYYKSRAMLMARSGSTLASAATTFCAVFPLLHASIGPLRTFGTVFTVVAVVTLLSVMGFFVSVLMTTGPGTAMTIHSVPATSLSIGKIAAVLGRRHARHFVRRRQSQGSGGRESRRGPRIQIPPQGRQLAGEGDEVLLTERAERTHSRSRPPTLSRRLTPSPTPHARGQATRSAESVAV